MVIANLSVDPNALRALRSWNPSGESVTKQQNDDGSWTYTISGARSVVVPFYLSAPYWAPGLSYVSVMYVDPVAGIEWGTGSGLTVLKNGSSDGIWHVRTTPDTGTDAPFWHPQFTCANPVTIRKLALYAESDWQALQPLGIDWFDGDLMPLGRS